MKCIQQAKKEFNLINIINEYDTNETNKKILENNRLVILGMSAGVGKSSLITNAYNDRKDDIIFVCPSNRLAYEYVEKGFISYTCHTFLSIGIDNERNKNMRFVDLTNVKAICFDEVLCYGINIRQKLEYFMKKNPDLKFYGTADKCQLKAPKITDKEFNYVSDKLCVSFPNCIMLKEIKRLDNEDDKQLSMLIKSEIFDLSYKWDDKRKKEVFRHFQAVDFDKIDCEKIITYTHQTEILQNTRIVLKQGGLKIGDIIVCKETYENKKIKLKCHRNYEYTIVNIEKKKNDKGIMEGIITCIDKLMDLILTKKIEKSSGNNDMHLSEKEALPFQINQKIFKDFFRMNYAFTCHSSQGLSVDGKGVICDILHPCASREWCYVSYTRFRKLKNNVLVCWNDCSVNNCNVKNLENKIMSYYEEDVKKNRLDNTTGVGAEERPIEGFVNRIWFFLQLQFQMYRCFYCENVLELDYAEGSSGQYSIDRIKNELPHISKNCVISCLCCNRKHSNLYFEKLENLR